jgi:hypothetical protein
MRQTVNGALPRATLGLSSASLPCVWLNFSGNVGLMVALEAPIPIEDEGAVRQLTVNRPDKRNAFNTPL